MVVLVLAGGAAQAQSLQVAGTAGYVSEWELSGEATQTVSEATKKYFGPLTIKHVGLCSHDGPQESQAKSNFRYLDQDRYPKSKRRFCIWALGVHTPGNCPTPRLMDLCNALMLTAFLSLLL